MRRVISPRVRVALSSDGGASFRPPRDVDNSQAVGRVDMVILDGGDIAVSWLRSARSGMGQVSARRIFADGTLGPIRAIAETNDERASGFPQMVRSGANLVFSWTDTARDQVATARMAISAL